MKGISTDVQGLKMGYLALKSGYIYGVKPRISLQTGFRFPFPLVDPRFSHGLQHKP